MKLRFYYINLLALACTLSTAYVKSAFEFAVGKSSSTEHVNHTVTIVDSPNIRLFKAILNEDIEGVKAALADGADPNVPDEYNQYPLFSATRRITSIAVLSGEDTRMLKIAKLLLLDYRVNPNIKRRYSDNFEVTPLAEVIHSLAFDDKKDGTQHYFARLLLARTDLDNPNPDYNGKNSIEILAIYRDFEIIQLILNHPKYLASLKDLKSIQSHISSTQCHISRAKSNLVTTQSSHNLQSENLNSFQKIEEQLMQKTALLPHLNL